MTSWILVDGREMMSDPVISVDDICFGARIRELWPQAAAELSAHEDGVVNSATGTVGGHLMQARDVRVEGGLHFGDVPRPDRRG